MTSIASEKASMMKEPVAGWLTLQEFRVVEALCETFFPSLDPPAGADPAVEAYYQRNGRDLHIAFLVAETLAQEDAATQQQLRQLFSLLQQPVSGLLLAGRPGAFIDLPQAQREKYLLAMANSTLPQLRQGYQAFKRLAGFLYFAVPDPEGHNPNWEVLDYTPPEPPPAAPRPIQPLSISGDMTLECDAVVVGSGAGGGVVAGELALAGKSVIVLEKGGYQGDADFSLQEAQAMSDLYLKRGTLATQDLGVIILAGSTLGGGTTVNWCTSFRTPGDVLEEWARHSGLPQFTAAPLQESFTAVERRINVNLENSAHNRQNQLLYEGAQHLGYHAGSLRRNAVGCEQRCGTCGFGCRYGCKQSTMKTYLQDAYDHGARIIVRCSVERVLIERGQAVGVVARVVNATTGSVHTVTIRAKATIVAAGSIHSPALLQRSGLENRHIGQHLHLHPTSTIAATYPEEVYPWQGVMQSAYSDEFAHLTANYGYKLEVPPTHPGLLGLATPWYSAREYREMMARAANIGTIIVLTRDRGEGSVTVNKDGEPVVHYVTSVFDRRHMLHGLRTAARVHFAAGATEVLSLHSKRTHLVRSEDSFVQERQLRRFDAQLERHGLGPNRLMVFSAHQMGSCRMGNNPRQSVVDGNQQVHGVKGLFVCDGSVFPAASGVNPMLTIMALAHRAAQYIKSVC